MKPWRLVSLAAAASVSLCVGAGHATVRNVASTLDVTDPGGDSTRFVYREAPEFDPVAPVAVAEGDTLIWTIDFKDDQQLTAIGLSEIDMFLLIDRSDPANIVASPQTSTGYIQFLGSAGETLFTTALTTTTLGNAHVGQEFNTAALPGAPARLSFFGVRYTGVLEDYLLRGLVSRTYNDQSLGISATRLLVGPDDGVGVVPEPLTWTFMVIGFGAVGAALRLRPRFVGPPTGEAKTSSG